jgi:RNA polymerase sigma factor for flagellar operon FliA
MEPESEEILWWQSWREDSDQEARQRLFLRYVPWARTVARDVYRRVRVPQMEWGDYAQNATVGLLQAMARFDADRGIAFIAFAKSRVRGAVFNGLRSFLADSVSHEGARWRERVESFDAAEVDDPLDQMIASVTGLGLGFLLESDATTALIESVTDASVEAEQRQMSLLIETAVAGLPEKERRVLTLHYHQHMPFVDIARLLGLTKGRISQIHKAALERVRLRLRGDAMAHQMA